MPLLEIGLGFLLGILGAGFGAVLAQRIREGALDDRLRRALVAEIEEDLIRLDPGAGGPGRGPMIRSAWDAARQIEWKRRDVLVAVAEAYTAGDLVNSLDDRVEHILDDYSEGALRQEQRRLNQMIATIESHGKAHAYFLRARHALTEGVVEGRPDSALWESQPPKPVPEPSAASAEP